ncbi:MAG: hypothetical protein ABI151_06010 [Chitinophagaceae bacterium]
MLNFCTLFNFNYLARGLALYESLEKHSAGFHLYVFAFDNDCYDYLRAHPVPCLTPISLADFETDDLLFVKPTRSMAEYCWTATSFTILHCLGHYKLDACTYLDADMIFYHDPGVLIEEMGEKSVLISEHRYPKMYDQSWYSGIYCVQFMCFKNTPDGLLVLNWWKDRCLEWCYGRLEDGKFGDQKYLDDWTTRFNSVHVMQHPGGGVAPWNLELYDFRENQEQTEVKFKRQEEWQPMIFFHFHGLKFFPGKKVLLAGPLYPISQSIKERIYFPYVQQLLALQKTIRREDASLNPNGAFGVPPTKTKLFVQFLRDLISGFAKHIPGVFELKNYNFKGHYHLHDENKL